MFTLAEELKFYEPGLEIVEESLTGDEEQDMVTIMQALLKAKPDPLAEREPQEEETAAAETDQTEEKETEASEKV